MAQIQERLGFLDKRCSLKMEIDQKGLNRTAYPQLVNKKREAISTIKGIDTDL